MKRQYILALVLALCLCLGGAVAAQAAAPVERRPMVQMDKGKGDGGKGKGIAQKEMNFSGVAKTVAVCLIVGAAVGGGVGAIRRSKHSPANERPAQPRRRAPAQRDAYYRPARKGERYGQAPDYLREEPAEEEAAEPAVLPPEERPAESWQPLSAWDTPPANWQPAAPAPKPSDPAPGPAPVHPSMDGGAFAAFDDLYTPAQDRDAWMEEPEEPIEEDDEPGDVNFIL